MEKKNCPNCGMPITGEKCEYCGTVFIDWAVIDANTPVFIKFRHNGKILRAKCIMESFSLTFSSEADNFYADNNIYTNIFSKEDGNIDIHLHMWPHNIAGVESLYEIIDEDKVDQDTLKEII